MHHETLGTVTHQFVSTVVEALETTVSPCLRDILLSLVRGTVHLYAN